MVGPATSNEGLDAESGSLEGIAVDESTLDGMRDDLAAAVDAVLEADDVGVARAALRSARLGRALADLRQRLGAGTVGANPGCGVGRNMLAITAAGDLFPCHRYVGMPQFTVGDVETGVDEPRLRRFYDDLVRGFNRHCGRCWARVVCGGQCAWTRSDSEGSLQPPTEASCDRIRSSNEELLAALAVLTALEGEASHGARARAR